MKAFIFVLFASCVVSQSAVASLAQPYEPPTQLGSGCSEKNKSAVLSLLARIKTEKAAKSESVEAITNLINTIVADPNHAITAEELQSVGLTEAQIQEVTSVMTTVE